jgi:hypothetical protein
VDLRADVCRRHVAGEGIITTEEDVVGAFQRILPELVNVASNLLQPMLVSDLLREFERDVSLTKLVINSGAGH